MIEKGRYATSLIMQEMINDPDNVDNSKINYWFDFKRQKFLHNIDTFYYSVKFMNDFTASSEDSAVLQLRDFFSRQYEILESKVDLDFLQLKFGDSFLNLRKFSFAHFYNICLEYPEWFDIFIAPKVPHGSDGGDSLTCELVVQIRSYMLWLYGVKEAFEMSYKYVEMLAEFFGLSVAFCQENRVDHCWHSNYLSNPEKFFSLENFYKMRVDRFADALTHTEKVGSQGYEIDYVALGRRSDKVFIRIYLKCKEVVEMGYKGWFLYLWFFNGLINRYDLYVYEECYKRKSWKYLNYARLDFYTQHGMDEEIKKTCRQLLASEITMEEDVLQRFADQLTPKVNLIMNVEYQTMRRHSKSYTLLPLRDNSNKKAACRIYDYLDNRKLIIDYLTYYVFRLVDPSGDSNKSRRDLCGFWKALRSCKLVDVHLSDKNLRLVREYSRKLNADLVKTRAINSIVTFGFYQKGLNDDPLMKDITDALCTMNDNDMEKALRYKNKRSKQFNSVELPSCNDTGDFRFMIVDTDTGVIYGDGITDSAEMQGGVSS